MNFGEILKVTIMLVLLVQIFRFCLYRTLVGRLILKILRTITSFIKFNVKDAKKLYGKGRRMYDARKKKQQARQSKKAAASSPNVIYFKRKRA